MRSRVEVALKRGFTPVIECHLSHLYADGASLYYTFLMPQSDDPPALWQEIKDVTCRAINRVGATISHHHGVGAAHQPYARADLGGELGARVLQAVKSQLDPKRVLNPGKLLPEVAPPALENG